MRLMIILVLVCFLTGFDLARKILYAEIETAGALTGAILGALLGFIAFYRSYRLAQKDIFVDKMNKQERKVMFLIIWPLFGVGAICFVVLKYIYLPDLNIGEFTSAGLCVFLFMFSLIGVVGIGCLERRHGKKFYLWKHR